LLAGARCLVLEDEFLIALDLQDILEAAGAAVTCYADADEALRVLREGARFDLAVLDVHLGGATRTSYSVAAALTVQRTPFVFLTGMRRDATIAAEYPQVPILEKPYQHAHVLDAVRNVLTK
jgi:CheY-like chemotaxis protein